MECTMMALQSRPVGFSSARCKPHAVEEIHGAMSRPPGSYGYSWRLAGPLVVDKPSETALGILFLDGSSEISKVDRMWRRSFFIAGRS